MKTNKKKHKKYKPSKETKRLIKEAIERGTPYTDKSIKAKPGECGYKTGTYKKPKLKIYYGLNTNAM